MAKGPRTVLTLADGIAAHWDLPRDAPEPLGGGYHNDVLRVGDVVIRIERRKPESVAWEHELLQWLHPEVPEAVAPLPARDGSTYLVAGDRVASVLPYVRGAARGGNAAAEVLARIHARGATWPQLRARPGRPAYSDLDWECNDWWDWSVVPKPPELVRAFEHVTAWVASEPALVCTPIHGDTAQQNFLWQGNRVAGVIDWEFARVDWAGIELAHAAWTLAEDERDLFVRTYVAAGGPGEADVREEGRRIQLLSNALYSLTRGDAGTDWVRYLLAELRELA